MIEDKYIISIADAVENVRKIQNKIDNEPYRNHKTLWAGADVSINSKNSSVKNNSHPFHSHLQINTPYAEQLSWSFYQMRDIFYSQNLIENISKYELFGRLAEVACDYHRIYGDGNEKDLLREISNEAMNILKEMFKSVKHGIS